MQRIAFGAVLGAMLVGGSAALAQAPTWTPPPESARCPSKWGAGDERGSGNHMKPQSVLNAVKLIKTGEVIELGHVLGANMPFFGTRRFDVHVKRTFMNEFANRRGSNEEIVISEIGRSARSSTASRTRPTRTAGTTASRSPRTRPVRVLPSWACTMSAR
jgi:hypothetical protein